MDFFPAIWNVLHDGYITKITGIVPGTLRLEVKINYLRTRFKEPGEVFHLTLGGCSRFAYRDFEDKETGGPFITDLAAIADINLEILEAEIQDGIAKVVCARRVGQGGELEVKASHGALALDNERTVTIEEIIKVAEEYWAGLKGTKAILTPDTPSSPPTSS